MADIGLFYTVPFPLMNTRTDEYGGSLENRAKFPIQICKSIREAVGPDFLIELRIDGTDHQRVESHRRRPEDSFRW